MSYKKPKATAEAKGITLYTPNTFCPCNGRILLQSERGAMYKQNESGIIIPTKQIHLPKDNRNTVNPDQDKDFFVVGFAPEVPEQMRLFKPGRIPEKQSAREYTEIEVGDMAILSPDFEPITQIIEGKEYKLIHWQDVLGLVKRRKEIVEEEE